MARFHRSGAPGLEQGSPRIGTIPGATAVRNQITDYVRKQAPPRLAIQGLTARLCPSGDQTWRASSSAQVPVTDRLLQIYHAVHDGAPAHRRNWPRCFGKPTRRLPSWLLRGRYQP